MASVVDICNLALAHLGDAATVTSITPPEGSAQATHCARFYPIARDAMLGMHDWSFAMRRTALAELTAAPPAGWTYAYAVPNECIAVRAVLPADATDDQDAVAFTVEAMDDNTRVIYSNEPDAVVRFVARVTDTTNFSAHFVEALGMLLASHLAGPIIKGSAGRKAAQEWGASALGYVRSFATAHDANQHSAPLTHTPSWIAAR